MKVTMQATPVCQQLHVAIAVKSPQQSNTALPVTSYMGVNMEVPSDDGRSATQKPSGSGEYNYVNWEALDDPLLQGEEQDAGPGTEWWTTGLIIAAIILGLGVLGLPYAFSTMGWLLGGLTMMAAAVGAVYAGITGSHTHTHTPVS